MSSEKDKEYIEKDNSSNWIQSKASSNNNNNNNNNQDEVNNISITSQKIYYHQSKPYELSDYKIPSDLFDKIESRQQQQQQQQQSSTLTPTTITKTPKKGHLIIPSVPPHNRNDEISSRNIQVSYPALTTPPSSRFDSNKNDFKYSSLSSPKQEPPQQLQQRQQQQPSTTSEMLKNILLNNPHKQQTPIIERSSIWEEYEKKKKQSSPSINNTTNNHHHHHHQLSRQMIGQMLMGSSPTPPPKPHLKSPYRIQQPQQEDEPIEDVEYSQFNNRNTNQQPRQQQIHMKSQQLQSPPIHEKKRKENESAIQYEFERQSHLTSTSSIEEDIIYDDTLSIPKSKNSHRSSIAETTKYQQNDSPTKISYRLTLASPSTSTSTPYSTLNQTSYTNLKRNNSFKKDRELFGSLLKDNNANNNRFAPSSSQQQNIISSQHSIQSQVSSNASYKSTFVRSCSKLVINNDQYDGDGYDENNKIEDEIDKDRILEYERFQEEISGSLEVIEDIIPATISPSLIQSPIKTAMPTNVQPSQSFDIRSHLKQTFYKTQSTEDIESSQEQSNEPPNMDHYQLSPTPPKVEQFYSREKFLILESMKKRNQELFEEDIDEVANSVDNDPNDGNRNLFGTFVSEARDETTENTTSWNSLPQKQTLKSILVGEIQSSMSASAAAPEQTPSKKLLSSKSMNRYEKEGGLSGRLANLLKKQNYNSDWITQRSIMPTQLPTHGNNQTILQLPFHFITELNVVVTELPSLLQPHVFLTTCNVISFQQNNTAADLSNLLPSNSPITVIFNNQIKDDWKVDIGSRICLEYWHLFNQINTKSRPTVLCLIGKLIVNNSLDIKQNPQDDMGDLRNIQDNFETISIRDQHHQNNVLNNYCHPKQRVNKREQSQQHNIFEDYQFTDLRYIHQNLLDINLSRVIVLRIDRFKKKQKQEYLRIIIRSHTGSIGEIQIPKSGEGGDCYSEKWNQLLEFGQNPPYQCFIFGLVFVQCKRIESSSLEGSIILSHIQSSLRPPAPTFSLVVFEAKKDSRFVTIERMDQDLLLHNLPSKSIYTVTSLYQNNIIGSLVGQRVTIQGTISHIHPSNQKQSSLTLFLHDNINNNLDEISFNSVSITLSKLFCEHFYQKQQHNNRHQKQQQQQQDQPLLTVGQTIIIKDAFMLPPSHSRSYTLLLADIYTTIGPAYQQAEDMVDADLSATQLVPIGDFVTMAENDNLQIMSSYQCLVSVQRAEIIEASKEFIYRGCTECFTAIRPYPIQNRGGGGGSCMGYTKEPFFCPKCRILVDSALMAELNLIIKLSNDMQAIVKIGHPYSAPLLPSSWAGEGGGGGGKNGLNMNTPQNNKKECQEFIDHINNNSSFININGAILTTNHQQQQDNSIQVDQIQFEIESISTPEIYTINI